MAGWTVATEQAVPIHPPRQTRRQRRQPVVTNATDSFEDVNTASAERAPSAAGAASVAQIDNHTVQADLVFLTPGGKRICGDVACTHNWAPQTAAESIQAMEKVKFRKYGVGDTAMLMPAAVLLLAAASRNPKPSSLLRTWSTEA
eukprot:5807650-Amphidinium_carterae.1